MLIGGYHGSWLPATQAVRLTLDNRRSPRRGAGSGPGIVLTPPPDRCALIETAAVVRYLALESAGQCGPCLNGLPRMAAALTEIAVGRQRGADAGGRGAVGRAGHRARRLPPPGRHGPVRAQRAAHVRRRGRPAPAGPLHRDEQAAVPARSRRLPHARKRTGVTWPRNCWSTPSSARATGPAPSCCPR